MHQLQRGAHGGRFRQLKTCGVFSSSVFAGQVSRSGSGVKSRIPLLTERVLVGDCLWLVIRASHATCGISQFIYICTALATYFACSYCKLPLPCVNYVISDGTLMAPILAPTEEQTFDMYIILLMRLANHPCSVQILCLIPDCLPGTHRQKLFFPARA